MFYSGRHLKRYWRWYLKILTRKELKVNNWLFLGHLVRLSPVSLSKLSCYFIFRTSYFFLNVWYIDIFNKLFNYFKIYRYFHINKLNHIDQMTFIQYLFFVYFIQIINGFTNKSIKLSLNTWFFSNILLIF